MDESRHVDHTSYSADVISKNQSSGGYNGAENDDRPASNQRGWVPGSLMRTYIKMVLLGSGQVTASSEIPFELFVGKGMIAVPEY
ncbi:hypothetical protein OGATHE_005471 [Ogataea polymorpha]|uniref:Uncharacterized protein n=1 Tax=Ogataea polymorpha TaxID=460523 RepID=A0A9P8NWG5_9ASCO|nr:hypothetical protein OGATHE_005471 [Ogataea polymorpha]